ncbi:hypothetical protein NDN11_04405 [Acinetobacter sp. C26M]|uniref:hypothetical protein n=1 Tax=unclassified Acinetobacter TaxID=196816 RepID=UPI00203745F6|nr:MULTISPECIES: hypothetical protein [unclassified Acinetobacter]USA47364.1 hypothetical protein NDN11_04405 [Acinetobacter sp. C26M]USA50845.1 hypothetical protein NDN12_04405 [Acinetobacter sp. C26G]
MNKPFQHAIPRLKARFTSSLIFYLKMNQFQYRGLTSAEIEMARPVFGDLIDYAQIKVFNIPYLPWQPANIFMAPNGNLFVHQKYFSPDYSKCSLSLQGIFIHELAHILQFQQGINVIVKGAILQAGYYLSLKRYNPYQYQFIKNKAFSNYNIEQQGDIARDIYFNKIPNIILEK